MVGRLKGTLERSVGSRLNSVTIRDNAHTNKRLQMNNAAGLGASGGCAVYEKPHYPTWNRSNEMGGGIQNRLKLRAAFSYY